MTGNLARSNLAMSKFPGSSRTQAAGPLLATDHDHASQAGHRVIANTIVALGLSPLRP
jgi:hypothetical protein